MDSCFLEGLIVVLLIQHCKAEDLSTSSLPSTEVTPQDGEALPQEPELPPAQVVPVVAPPSLKEVEQAVQEASEQVEGWEAEEVLKELLERVVEAALGEAGGGSEEKVREAEEQEGVEEEVLGAGKEDAEAEVEVVVEQAAEEEVVAVEDIGAMGGDADGGEEQEVTDPGVDEVKGEVEAVEAVAEVDGEGKGVVEGESEAESVKETKAGGEFRGAAAGEEVIDESPGDPEVTQEVVEETVASLGEIGGEVTGDATGVEGKEGQEVLSEEEGAAETEIQETEEAPAVVEREPEQEIVADSDPSLGVVDVEQIGGVGEEGEAGEEETQGGEVQGGVVVAQLPPDDHEDMNTTHSVVGEPAEEEEKEETVKDTEGGTLVAEGGLAEEEEAGRRAVAEAAGGEGDGGSMIKEESVVLLHDGVDRQGSKAAGEEQTAVETLHASQAENQEVLVIPAAEPGDGTGGEDETPIEQGPEDRAPPLSPSLGGAEMGGNTIGGEARLEEQSNHANEINTSTHDLLPHDPAVAAPTLDNFVEDVPATPPQSEGEEPGQANELVEDTAGKEAGELGLEAWKIGAISAAVFLVLETVVIIVYILKCRSKTSSTPAPQRACEEGCVEPEATTGGDCNDDTLPAGNGDTQQIAALDPSGVASTMAQTKEQQEEEQAIAISDLPPSSTEESANSGPGPDSSQDLRTSVL